ncbi:hypothetical protein TWF788_006060 [Orbilia oligospora]|uniref:Uncharacterized protein n=1 Tax=Orbilia oligospora TaxID=2813651 RepID=A0A7C8U683_ORBOL|nr:hypothetical protein TWF788_006060 [Orbilia oligospora]
MTGKVGLVPRSVAFHALHEVVNRDRTTSMVYRQQLFSNSSFANTGGTMRDLYREWTFTFANPLLLYQLMILSYDTRGYVFRLLREYRFTAPPIDGLLVFSEATSTDIESPGRQTRLFDIVHPSTPISDESNSAFRTWALMTHDM